MARAFRPWRQPSMYACSMSSTVAPSGRLTVLEMAPEMKGWTAPIILTCPSQWTGRGPFCGFKGPAGAGGGGVDDLHEAAADKVLVLDEGDVRLDARGVAVHHEADGAGGSEDGGLGVG